METNKKMSYLEKYYKFEADQGETRHITKHIIKTS
jgi:hypothetical protein